MKRLNLEADEVLLELLRIATSDIRQVFDAQGNLKAVKDLPDDVAAALSSVEVIRRNRTSGDGQSDTIHKLRFWDKPRALELLAKHFRLLEHDDTKPPVKPQKLVTLIQRAPHDLTP